MKANRSNRFLIIVEQLLNPDDDYNSFKGRCDSNYVKPTHNVLRAEAAQYLDPDDNESESANAMLYYIGDDYEHMNNLLRYGKLGKEIALQSKSAYEKQNKHLKSLTKNPTEHEFYVYRGVKDNHNFVNAKSGDIVHDKGFTSTSLRPMVAMGFSNDSDEVPKNSSLYRIHVTPGTRGFYASSHGKKNSPKEAEFILHPGTKFRVGKTHRDLKGKRFTDLHIHSQEE